MPTSTKPKLLSPVLLRVAGLSIDKLDGLRAPVVTYRLQQHEQLLQRLQRSKESLLTNLFSFIENDCPAGKPQQQLQQIRRDLHNDRLVRPKDLDQAARYLPATLLLQLRTYIGDRQKLETYVITTAKLYRQQAIQGRRHFQRLIGDVSFQRGLAFSSLSLLRQLAAYQQTDPANFRKDDFQIENGLLRYLSRAATKTTPYSTLTHLATVPIHVGESQPWKSGPARSHIRLSVRLLGVFDAMLRSNRRLCEQWTVTVNPSALITDDKLSYIRQTDGQVSCVRMAANPVLRWVARSRYVTWTYKEWVSQIQQRFRSSNQEANQYIAKLIELGLLHHLLPVSATDPDWAVRLHDWLISHRWLSARFVDSQLTLLNALRATADTLPVATSTQRLSLLLKAQGVLAEHVAQLSQPPTTDFWPLRPEQLFFEDVTRSLQGHLPTPAMKRLTTSLDRLVSHIAEAYVPPSNSLVELFKTTFPTTESVLLTTFFGAYLSQSNTLSNSERIPAEYVATWKQWAANGLNGKVVHLNSNWIGATSGNVASQAVFWQHWLDKQGQLWAAVNELTGGFGRLYGRFLPYFSHTLTHELNRKNRDVTATDYVLVEATDDHYHNANFHPQLLDGAILTPAGHWSADAGTKIPLNELTVSLSDDGTELELWHRSARKRVQVVDMGFQASRSRLYSFLCLFRPVPELSLTLFTSVVNQWYESQQPAESVRIWPRIVLDSRLIIQRQTWWLPVGSDTTLSVDGDAFTFFRATYHWKQRHQLPDEVFVSLPGAPNADDHKPQYIRFDNPLLIDLFRRLVRKAAAANALLKVVEMRPTSDELLCIDGQRYAVESVPQWYGATPDHVPSNPALLPNCESGSVSI